MDICNKNDQRTAYLAASLVGYTLGLKAEDILSHGGRSQGLVQARQAAMYLAHVGRGMSISRVAVAFDRDRSTVANACQRIEDRRDDVEFDGWIDALEQGFMAVAPLSHQAA